MTGTTIVRTGVYVLLGLSLATAGCSDDATPPGKPDAAKPVDAKVADAAPTADAPADAPAIDAAARDGATDAGANDGAGADARDGSPTPVIDAAATDAPDGAATVDAGPDAVSTLYTRLGSQTGIRAVMTDFVVNRVLNDPKINGYFLNSGVDGARLINCLTLQVGNLAGGPEVYPSAGCRDMKTTHLGMKISMQDFSDLANHLVAALTTAGVSATDVNTIVAAVTPLANDIVEDRTNNGTVYQRILRKPAINTLIDKVIVRVVADARVNGFFAGANAPRLKTCLVRQVCGIDGPCKYGQEVTHASEPGVSPTMVCRDMKTTHTGLTSPPGGGAGSRTIAKADWDAFVEDLVTELDAAMVAPADKAALLAALGPTCDDIVAGGTGCPGKTVTALVGGGAALVTFDSKVPGTVSAPVDVTGMAAGEDLLAITFRPSNGHLYGLGDTFHLYDIDPATGAATAVSATALTPPPTGAVFGVDVNPVVDAIRVVTDANENFRVSPTTGAILGSDTAITPAGTISAVSYTNSVPGATATTLYAIDVTSDKLVMIGGPNSTPSPNTGAITEVGDLGVDATGAAGFEIARNGALDVGYAVLTVAAASTLYTIDLTTGHATAVGAVGGGGGVISIAVK
jgi:truncated hemoglobin YjbI